MNDRFEDRLGHSLQRHAEQAAPSRRDLTGGAIERARRIRARRRTTTVVAGLALIAGMVPVSVNLTGGTNDRTKLEYAQPSPSEPTEATAPTGPVETSPEELTMRTPEPSEPDRASPEDQPTTPGPEEAEPSPDPTPTELPIKARTVEIDFASLSEGPAPAVPYLDRARGLIVDGGTEVPVELSDLTDLAEVAEIVRVSGGYAVQTTGEQLDVFLVDPDGNARPLSSDGAAIETYAANVDGDRIAWVEGSSDSGRQRLVMADGFGELLEELPGGGTMKVAGFLFDRVAVRGEYGDLPFIWEPPADTEPVDSGVDVLTTDGISYLTVLTGEEDEEFRPCSALLDTDNGHQELWASCERRVYALSRGGHYALTVDARFDALGGSEFDIVNGATGQRLASFSRSSAQFDDFTFESSGAVLVDAADDGQHAIIRCLPVGECEFATPPRPFADPSGLDPAPYVLGK